MGLKEMEKIKLELDREEAEAFRLFRQHQENMGVLLRSRVFEVRDADVILSFDQNGVINGIKRHDVLFARRVRLNRVTA